MSVAPLPPPLQRAREGRWLAGVCRGFATRWEIPVAQVRALFAVASALAGLGLLAYVACWLVLPADGDTDDGPSVLRGLVSLALLAAASAGLLTLAAAASAATLFGLGWAVAVAVGVFLVGALVAWPTLRPAWILLPLAAVAVPAAATAASGLRMARQTGVQIATPTGPDELPASGYRAGLGDLLVDLRQFEAPPDAQVPLRIEAGVGETVVALPHDRCFDLDVRWRTHGVAWDVASRLLNRGRGSYVGPFFYGRPQPRDSGRWIRVSADPHAPRLRIDFSSLDGGLILRDYPDSTGPLFEPYWPNDVKGPPSPGQLRWAWRPEVRTRAVQRRWRIWRKAAARSSERFHRLMRGGCPASEAR